MNWRDIPSLSALRAFEAVAREGSITKAANALNVTHAAIAQHIRTLESELKTKLTHREGRGISLTTDGIQLSAALSDGFGTIHAGIRSLTDTDPEKPVNLTTTPSFAENWLMPRLGKFWRDHPEITLSITPSTSIVDLDREPFDLAIRYGGGTWPGLNASFLVAADYILVAAPSLIRKRDPKGIDDLQDQLWLFNTFHKEPRRWAENNGLDMRCCQIKEFESLGMVLSALRAGVGVSVVSKALVARDIEAGQLCEIVKVPADGMGYHIVTSKAGLTESTKTLKRWLQKTV